MEEIEGGEGGFEEGGGVEEARLVKVTDGVGGVEGGDCGDAAEGDEAMESFAEVGFGWAEGGGKIGAEGNSGDHANLLRMLERGGVGQGGCFDVSLGGFAGSFVGGFEAVG